MVRVPRVSARQCKGVSLSTPIDMLHILDELREDYGSPSAFWQLSLEAYVQAKGASTRRPDMDELGVALLKARVEADRKEAEVKLRNAARYEQRIEAWQEELEEKRASGVASLKFETAEALVAHWYPKLADNGPEAPAWKNLSQRYGLRQKEVRAVAARHAAQATLPRGKRS